MISLENNKLHNPKVNRIVQSPVAIAPQRLPEPSFDCCTVKTVNSFICVSCIFALLQF
jgi:hypothetical protein